MAKEKIIKMTDKEWLEKKSHSIGGSEISAILGLNPYQTAIDVYINKTEGKQVKSNISMRAGTILESLIADLFQEETGYKVFHSPKRLYEHPEYNYLVVSPDRLYETNNVLECKNTSVNYDGVPDFWQLQDIWGMGIIGSDGGSVAYLKNNNTFGFIEIDFNKELFEAMVETAKTFWNNHVLQHIPPPITEANKSEVAKIYRSHVEGLKIKASKETFQLLNTLSTVKKIKKIVEDKEKDLSETIKFIMKDSEAIIDDNDNLLSTWKKNKDGKTFDEKRFKEENPDLYSKYLIDKFGARPLLIKDKNLSADLTQDGINNLINSQILLQ